METQNLTLPRLTIITGGIGAGKTVVCSILRHMEFEVYNCDAQARRIMDNSDTIIENIAANICREAIRNTNGTLTIHRPTLAKAVFADPNKLQRLNTLVHGEVLADIRNFRNARQNTAQIFVETAIAHSSGIDRMADDIWLVTAPHELRIARATRRDNAPRPAIEERIAAQTATESQLECSSVHHIINDGHTPLLPQIFGLLSSQYL